MISILFTAIFTAAREIKFDLIYSTFLQNISKYPLKHVGHFFSLDTWRYIHILHYAQTNVFLIICMILVNFIWFIQVCWFCAQLWIKYNSQSCTIKVTWYANSLNISSRFPFRKVHLINDNWVFMIQMLSKITKAISYANKLVVDELTEEQQSSHTTW